MIGIDSLVIPTNCHSWKFYGEHPSEDWIEVEFNVRVDCGNGITAVPRIRASYQGTSRIVFFGFLVSGVGLTGGLCAFVPIQFLRCSEMELLPTICNHDWSHEMAVLRAMARQEHKPERGGMDEYLVITDKLSYIVMGIYLERYRTLVDICDRVSEIAAKGGVLPSLDGCDTKHSSCAQVCAAGG